MFHLQPYSIWSLLILIADVYAIVRTAQSSATTGVKVTWIVVVIVLPLLGFILWLLFGPKGGR